MTSRTNRQSWFSYIIPTTFFIYFLGLTCSIPYFNYKYAKEHGFTSWLLLGEILPTAKACIWPYYAYQNLSNRAEPLPKASNPAPSGDIPQSINEAELSLNNFDQGMKLHGKWSYYMLNKENLPIDEAWRKADSTFISSKQLLLKVDPKHLSRIHPELPIVFKTKYLKLVEMETTIFYNRESFKFRNNKKQYYETYSSLLTEYMDWWNANSKNFKEF